MIALGDSRYLVGALQLERDTSILVVDPNPSHSTINVTTNGAQVDAPAEKLAALTASRRTTDTALSRFTHDLTTVEYTLLDPAVRIAVTDAEINPQNFVALRAQVDSPRPPSVTTIRSAYTTMIAANVAFLQRASSLITNPDVALSLASTAAVDNVVEYMERGKVISLQMLRFGLAMGEPLDSSQRQLVTLTFVGSDNIRDIATT